MKEVESQASVLPWCPQAHLRILVPAIAMAAGIASITASFALRALACM